MVSYHTKKSVAGRTCEAISSFILNHCQILPMFSKNPGTTFIQPTIWRGRIPNFCWRHLSVGLIQSSQHETPGAFCPPRPKHYNLSSVQPGNPAVESRGSTGWLRGYWTWKLWLDMKKMRDKTTQNYPFIASIDSFLGDMFVPTSWAPYSCEWSYKAL